MVKKKVLILHGKTGLGHLMVAEALMEVFSRKYPEVDIREADCLDFFRRPLGLNYSHLYDYVVAKVPFLFRALYHSYNNKLIREVLEKVTLFFVKKSQLTFFVKDFSPDFILATNPLPLQLVSLIEEKKIIDVLSANVCTDFGFHALWYSSDIDYYFVATEEIKKSLVDHGVSSDKIKVTGIPIRLEFRQLSNRSQVLKSLNFNSSQPVLLIMTGQLGYSDLLEVIGGITKKNNLVQFIVVTGRDKTLQKKLESSELGKKPAVRTFGLVWDIGKFMTASDLILSKAGGSTTAECLVKGLPMVVYKEIPGQEEDNVSYLLDNKAGVKVKSIIGVIEVVADLFARPDQLERMKASCRKIQKPDAAENIVDFVVSQIK